MPEALYLGPIGVCPLPMQADVLALCTCGVASEGLAYHYVHCPAFLELVRRREAAKHAEEDTIE